MKHQLPVFHTVAPPSCSAQIVQVTHWRTQLRNRLCVEWSVCVYLCTCVEHVFLIGCSRWSLMSSHRRTTSWCYNTWVLAFSKTTVCFRNRWRAGCFRRKLTVSWTYRGVYSVITALTQLPLPDLRLVIFQSHSTDLQWNCSYMWTNVHHDSQINRAVQQYFTVWWFSLLLIFLMVQQRCKNFAATVDRNSRCLVKTQRQDCEIKGPIQLRTRWQSFSLSVSYKF